MARKQITDLSAWPSLSLEGGIISAAMIASIDRREAPEQSDEGYGLRKGLSLRDEVSTAFRVAQAHFDAFSKLESPSLDATARYVKGLLQEAFGFDDLASATLPIALTAGEGRVPVCVCPPQDELDKRSEALSGDRSRSAAFALQDWLNERDDALWGLATNGHLLRLMRDNASLTRPAYIEANLAQIFETEDIASFAALWLIVHRSRFGAAGTPDTDCALERWREAGTKEGETARDRLAGQVEEALKVLGTGFLKSNPDLAQKIADGEVDLTDWFNELLRLVYRLIFLMVAEDRELLHDPRAAQAARRLYTQGYSLAHLRELAIRRSSWDRHHDKWEGLKIVFMALARGEEKLGLPALGGLFEVGGLPTVETARLNNTALMEAIYKLAWLSDGKSLVRVNWRAMETEELGSVYESLLELQPQLNESGHELRFATDASEVRGNQRKKTGSYYTPDSLVQALLDSALDPVLEKAEAEADDPVEGLLNLSVIDPACGSGHFLLAAARRIATRVARLRGGGAAGATEFRHALRDVARRCIYGVDRNPMAVELTKVALWIETIDPGLPLGFFDTQIRCGDALLGVYDLEVLKKGIPDAAYKVLTGDDKAVANYYAAKNKKERAESAEIAEGFGFSRQKDLVKAFAKLKDMPETTVGEVRAKSKKLKLLTQEGDGQWALARACDLYVSAFLLRKLTAERFADQHGLPQRGREMVPTSGSLWEHLRGVRVHGPMMAAAVSAAAEAKAFHWPLEFPDLMAGGGFDTVLGNPPWERIKLQEQEFFASRSPEIANAPNKAAREKLIRALEDEPEGSPKRAISTAFTEAKHQAETTSGFVRVPANVGGRFPLSGRGDVNTYSLFVELFLSLMNTNGMAGAIVPTGIATDATTATLFSEIVSERKLLCVHSFENEEFIFPGVHHSFMFSILCLSNRPVASPTFCFFLRRIGQLSEEERKFSLPVEAISQLNPATGNAPIFRSKAEAELVRKIYARVPVLTSNLANSEPNAWGIKFMRMFDMSNDSALFKTTEALLGDGFSRCGIEWTRGNSRYLPLYEAKMFDQYNHRYADYSTRGNERGHRVLPRLPEASLRDPRCEAEPFYWISEEHIKRRISDSSYLLGYGEATTASTNRTFVATAFPYAGVGHKQILFTTDCCEKLDCCLLANFNSLVFDFVTRTKVSYLTLAQFIVRQLPTLPPIYYDDDKIDYVSSRVLELSYTSHSMSLFARDLGYDGPPFAWDEDRRALLRAELDAFYARAYGLSRDELRYVLDPADVKGPDYPSETFRVLKEKEIRLWGEYRTGRVVLEAWDRMEQDGTFAELGL